MTDYVTDRDANRDADRDSTDCEAPGGVQLLMQAISPSISHAIMQRSVDNTSGSLRSHRQQTRVAFQGELGAYSDEAIKSRWSDSAESVPAATFSDVVALVKSARVEYGVIPIWNTILGTIAPGDDVVRPAVTQSGGLAVVGDVHVVVRHHLLALPGTTLDELDSVASHPVALTQCQRFLELHPRLIPQPADDTAGAVRDIAVRRTRGAAAIAGLAASRRYGLISIASDIQDVPDNITHFVVLTRLDIANRMGARLW